MTEETSQNPVVKAGSCARSQPGEVCLHYQVAMPQPASHLFEVTLAVTGIQPGTSLDLRMPVWTPGSYLIREYARHVQDFTAWGLSAQGNAVPLSCHKQAKNHWQVQTRQFEQISIRYRVYANELSVRTNHLDITHGYFNGAALFFYVPEKLAQPILVTIVPPHPDWQVTTPLETVPGQHPTFLAPDFDTLVDSPFEIGNHQLYTFEVSGKSHQLAIWGEGNANADRIMRDTQRVIEMEARLFGGLPYDRYLFLLHLSPQGNGGLEHKNACSLNYPRFGFQNRDKYNRFMQLVAHEFFHLWNIKRIRPLALEKFDYDRENYTPSLWFSEGTTSYYDLLIPLWAGIYDAQFFLNNLGKEITRFLTTPGRKVQPLSESSLDAWIKLYRPDANSHNSQMSYYLKGELVSLLLDLLIRTQHGNQRSLNQVMVQMWQQFGVPEIGFTEDQLWAVIESVAGLDLSDFRQRYLHSTDDLPLADYLEPFGLSLQSDLEEGADLPPYLGLLVKQEHGRDLVKQVETNSPAQNAGIDTGDELLAIEGLRVTAEQLADRLRDYQPGSQVQLTLFHQDELKHCRVILEAPKPTRYQVIPVEQPTPLQKQQLMGWLGTMP
ncbi:peptidase M61 [Leptolyngbya sp. 'hensonii']|nr:peptidase M61 [Leptolyngbya sp. 'hensonii']